jgi:uncharacterized protein YbdZ (MbtH family)
MMIMNGDTLELYDFDKNLRKRWDKIFSCVPEDFHAAYMEEMDAFLRDKTNWLTNPTEENHEILKYSYNEVYLDAKHACSSHIINEQTMRELWDEMNHCPEGWHDAHRQQLAEYLEVYRDKEDESEKER